MNKQWWWRALALLVVFGLVAAACGDDDDDVVAPTDDSVETDDGADEEETPTPEPTDDATDDDATDDGEEVSAPCDATVPGTEINYGIYAPGRSLDPPNSSGALVGGTELAAIYDVLFRFNPDTGEFDPHLAVSLEPNEDDTVWTLTLREGITFDDGTPFDAQLVVDNIARYAPEEGTVLNTMAAFVPLIEESVVIDDLTVEFRLVRPWAWFPFLLNDETGMVVNLNAIGDDPEAFGALPPPEAGVGPYIVERNVPGEELVMRARDNYWGGPVCVETLRFDLATASAIVGVQTSYDAFRNGDVDVAFLRNESVIAQARADGAKESMAFQDGGAMLIMNLRDDAPLSDPLLREAVALAIDVDVLNDRAYGGDLTVGKSMILPGSDFHTSGLAEIPTDPDRAAELVEESGFTGTLRILCATGPEATEVALATQGILESIGIAATVENLPTTDQIGKLVTGDYDIGCWGINAGPDTIASSFIRNFLSTSPANRQGLADPDLDDALQALYTVPLTDMAEPLAAVNDIYVSNFFGVPFGSLWEGVVIADDLEGVLQTGSTIFLFHRAYWAN